ncbi:MAG: TDT family transporter [Firmicutes bacterium]|nr:TDT family transporter [Bacillota bacterium]
MKNIFINFIKSVPLALSGVALGLAALGNVLRTTFTQSPEMTGIDTIGIIRYSIGALALLLLIMVALRIAFDFSHVKQELTYTHKQDEWKTSIPLSSLATITMAVMLLAGYIRPHASLFALIVWYIALILQCAIMIFFAIRFIPKFKIYAVYPSWFIVGVGIVVASVTAPTMELIMLGQIFFYIGLVLYFIIFALVILKMITAKYFMEAARPTIAIFAAPMSLLVVGYFSSFRGTQQWSYPLFYFMLIAALFIYAFVLYKMISLIRIKFYATYAGFTFPLVISATAFRIAANITQNQFLNTFAHFALWLSILACAFVVVHYIKYFIFWASFSSPSKKIDNNNK